jgi:hypothetical protein
MNCQNCDKKCRFRYANLSNAQSFIDIIEALDNLAKTRPIKVVEAERYETVLAIGRKIRECWPR